MAFTAQEIYSRVCAALMEDTGLLRGLYTVDQFLSDLRSVVMDFLQRTGMVKALVPLSWNPSTGEAIFPDYLMDVQEVFWGGVALKRETGMALDNLQRGWTSETAPRPARYHEDRLPVHTLRLQPIPDGSISGDLEIIGTVRPDPLPQALGDEVGLIPRAFASYIAYGVLYRVFSRDGETRDVARAEFCRARYEEGIALGAIASDENLVEPGG